MTAPVEGRQCTATGLHLVAADGGPAFRVAKDRHGALSAPRRDAAASANRAAWGRFDTVGSTLYFAGSRECAYGEVLTGFRLARGALAPDAEAAGYELDEWVDVVTEQAVANGMNHPWAVDLDWHLARSIYEIRLPSRGWWVVVDHADTLNALIDQHPHRALRANPVLTLADLEGDDRALTTVLAAHVRDLMLDDGSEALGITFASKTGYGRCWAFWDRRTDAGLGRGSDYPVQVSSANVGADPAFHDVAASYGLPVLEAGWLSSN